MLFMPGFLLFFGRFLGVHQSDSSIKLILIIKSSHLLIDFAFGLPSSYADHYLKVRTRKTIVAYKTPSVLNKRQIDKVESSIEQYMIKN